MSKIIKYSGLFLFLFLCLYYTNFAVMNLRNHHPIMQKIRTSLSKYEVLPTDASIIQNDIVSGSFGTHVDVDESFQKMNQYGAYNELLTVFSDTKPNISIADYYDKYLVKGNGKRREVGLVIILNNDQYLSSFVSILKNEKISATFFIDGTLLEKSSLISNLSSYEVELLSYANTYQEVFFKSSLSYLSTLMKKDLKFCFTEKENSSLLNLCSQEGLHTVKGKIIQKDLYHYVKENVDNSMMIAVDEKTLKELSSVIRYVRKKGYQFVSLETLFCERDT